MYNLRTIGNKDWHTWGSELFVAHQTPAGGWLTNSYPGSNAVTDTSMALLFLCRTNLAEDLTFGLRGAMSVSDPGRR
jgi:hypothetical protein